MTTKTRSADDVWRGVERRRFPRVSVATEVELDVFNEIRVIAGVCEDLSLGGLRLQASDIADEGETVLVALALPPRMFVSLAQVLASSLAADRRAATTRLEFRNLADARRSQLSSLMGMMNA